MAHFFINKGLVAAGLVAKFDIAYWILSALAVRIQLATIWLVVKLNLRLLSAEERRMTGSKRKEVTILIVNPGSVGVAMQRHATYMTSKRRTDMGVVSSKTARHTVRLWVFWAWVVASGAVAIFIGVAGPFSQYFVEARSYVAYSVPALMFFMLATGIGWLVLMVISRPPHSSNERQERGPDTPK